MLIALVGFPMISETIYTPALPAVAEGLKASAHAVEATLAIYFVGFAMGVSMWGAISDFLGRRPVILIGLCIYGFSCFACAYANHVEALLGWRFLQALGASVGSVITQTMLRDAYEGKERIKLFSVISGALAFSPAIGPILGGFISEIWGWRANFLSLLLLAGFLLIWCIWRLPETRPANLISPSLKFIKQLAGDMLTSKKLWGHILLIGTTNGILFSFYEEGPFIFIDYMGMHPSQYGLLGLLVAASTVISARISYILSRSITPERLIGWGAWIVLLNASLFTLIVSSGFLVFDHWLVLTILALLGLFIGIGLIIPNSLSIAMKPYQTAAGTAGSLFGGMYYVLIAGYTWIMSLLHNGTPYPLPIYFLALGILLVAGSHMIAKQAEVEENSVA